MCGIAGLVWKNQRGKRLDDFRRAAALMAHRGPDSNGEYLDDRLLLVHYRLAVVALGETGQQPFVTTRGDKAIGVYNGELYNYRDVVKSHELDTQSQSDTEALFLGLHIKGPSILSEYNGIFAFAQYFPERHTLLLARDRLGVKPLYYIDAKDFIAFASEAKVLYSFMNELPIDTRVLHEYMRFGSSMSMGTIVSGVRKVDPGSFLELSLHSLDFNRNFYWNLRTTCCRTDEQVPDYKRARKRTSQLLADAVERQCMADVPIGTYLSGGLDSSIVTAMAAEWAPGRLSSFSVRFEGSENSELPLARQVAERYGTDHHEMEISTRHLEEDLEDLIIQYDEPFADPAALPLHLMAAKSSQITKVVLQGDGGDELFAGYGRHLDLSQFRRRRIAFGFLARFHPKRMKRDVHRRRYQPLAKRTLSERLASMTAPSNDPMLSLIFNDAIGGVVLGDNSMSTFEQCARDFHCCSPVQQMLCTDMMAILPHTFLEKVDKVSMWHSVEARVPMLDNDLVDYVVGLPSHYKIRNGNTKWLLRDIATDWLPQSVVEGRKHSFGTPMDVWVRTLLHGFISSLFKRCCIKWGSWFDFEYLNQLLDEHRQGRADHSGIIWRTAVLLIWLEKYQSKISFNRGLGEVVVN